MKHIKLADVILIAVILIAVLLWSVIRSTDEPCQAVIYVDGVEYTRIELSDTENEEIINIGNVCIYAYNGKIQINSSDCPDKVCVNEGAVYKPGSVIACVPNGIVVSIVKSDAHVDGVTG